ncbi:hypothetical protein Tco_1388209, partial [Tanacetum coccineum]
TVMSDYEDSTVIYTAVSSPFADLPNIGSPGVDGPPVPGPEYPPSPEFVLEPVYPKFMPPEDEILPAEEQPLPAAISPTADSPGYVPESDPEEYLKEKDDEDPKEDPADYPADGGDDGDDEDDSSNDDKDTYVDIKGDEEEEEHPALADSIAVALPAVDQAPSAEETESFETDESAATPPPHPAYQVTTRISIRDEPPTPLWSDIEVARLLAIPTPPPSPLSPWSSALPQIPSPPLPPILSPLPVSPPLPVSSPPPASHIRSLGYRSAMIRLRAEALSSSHLPPLHIILSNTKADTPPSDRPDVTLPPQKRLGIALGPRYEVGESSSAAAARPTRGLRAGYGFVATIDREIMRDLERDVELGRRMTEFTTRVRKDTDEIYTRLDDEQYERQLMAGRLNMLYRDMHVMSLRTQVVAQQAVITELREADRRRQAAITEMLAADRRRQEQFIEALRLLKRLQTQMTEFKRQQGPAKGPTQPDAPEEAGSSS